MDRIDKEARPLDDDDVAREQELIYKLSEKNQQIFSELTNEYLLSIKRILVAAESVCTDDKEKAEIDRLKRIIKLCPLDELFIRSKDKIYSAREQIKNKDMAFFTKKEYKSLIKEDFKKSMIESILSIVKYRCMTLTQEESEYYWQIIFKMLNLVTRYEILMLEFR